MEVKIGLTHKCEIVAQGVEDPIEYVRVGKQLKALLDPYYAETFDPVDLKAQIDEIFEPYTGYEGELVFLEFLVGKNIKSEDTLIVTETEFNKYKYALPDDGLYVYYKLAIQKKEYLGDKYNSKIYYDNGKIMLGDEEIKDPSALVDYLTQTGVGILDYCEELVFSLCKLEHCVFNIQKQILASQLRTCGSSSKCDKNTSLRDQRNFLFISLSVLKHLISEEKYDEAEEILESLNSCGSLCKNIKEATKDCGCGSKN